MVCDGFLVYRSLTVLRNTAPAFCRRFLSLGFCDVLLMFALELGIWGKCPSCDFISGGTCSPQDSSQVTNDFFTDLNIDQDIEHFQFF